MQINSDQCQEVFGNYTEMIVTFSLHIERKIPYHHSQIFRIFLFSYQGKDEEKTKWLKADVCPAFWCITTFNLHGKTPMYGRLLFTPI